MSTVILSLVLDIVVAGLLGATIFYCTKLNRRIRILQDSKSELAQLIQQFDESTQLATRSINEIHSVSKKINENIKGKLDKANYIVDDLTFMIEKGSKLADRMESDISGARKTQQPQQPIATLRVPPAAEASEREDAPSRVPRRPASPRSNAEEEKSKRNAGLESMLEKIAQKRAASAPTAAAESSDAARKLRGGPKLRSKAEQELYDALKSEH